MKPIIENQAADKIRELPGKTNQKVFPQTTMGAMTQNNWSTGVITFSFGVGVGALLALLFAPSSGKETREHIADTLDQGLNEATSTAKRWARRAQDTVDEVT